ncbi:flagellar brake protein [Massilia horti]|uniref:Flagellar brake protein n=1 Tax=Massilia horti TaxID=2562153 RepID=A0A4Y9T1T8_9BURK|nr:flagellar brake protein [Massilia horti]TFW33249.1 flagellar brake protein [Massilia horti]
MSTTPPHELKAQELEFEAMNLQVGVRLQFITHRRVKPIQYFSTLIGYVKDEYMIVKIPMENGAPIPLTEGERLTIRVFSGVNVCSFACTVERVFARPLFYVHVSFPGAIQGTSLRGAMRVRVDIPVQVSATGGAPVNGILANLSVTGALVQTTHPLPPADIVTLQFTLVAPPGNQEVRLQVRASVRNMNIVRPDAQQAEVYAYGVQFVDLEPAHYTLLQNLTYEALLADRQKIV